MPQAASVAWPDPVPDGLVTPFAMGAYDGLLRRLVIGHKERAWFGLVEPLVGLLCGAVTAAVRGVEGDPIVLVAVPSRPGASRRRGHDPIRTMVERTARQLSPQLRVRAAPLLVSRRGLLDQAGLDRVERADNLAGSLHCRGDRLAALARRWPAARVVICDDVITTGSTAREAQRALEVVGVRPHAIATIAATVRRHPTKRGNN